MALTTCLDCRAICTGSRCPACTKARKKIRNADIPIARAQVAAQPWCVDCGATTDLTADHVVPLARGGRNDGQRQTLCRSCNSRKGAR